MSEKKRFIEYYETNGVKQYLLHHRSPSADAPVMLIVHGGPAFPDSNAAHMFSKWWGGLYHLVSWDQRGCGKTLAANGEPPSYPITARDILSDMVLIVQHLKASYGADKVYLLGISWGTVLCTLYTLDRPEDVITYIAAGQFCNFYRNEVAAYAKVREAAEAAGNRKDIAVLDSLLPYPEKDIPRGVDFFDKKLQTFKRLQAKYRLSMRIDFRLFWIFTASPTFKLSDYSSYAKKSVGYKRELVDFLLGFEILNHGFDYKTPVCYIVGERDFQTAIPLATEYFEKINAPKKILRVIKDASHNMMFDQPEAFANALADAKALAEEG